MVRRLAVIAVLAAGEIELGGGERLVRGQEVQVRPHRAHGVAHPEAHDEHVIERPVRLHSERHADVAL